MNVETSSLEQRARVHAALGDPTRLAVVEALALGDRTPGDLALDIGVESNLLAHHLRQLEEVGMVVRRRSEGDGRRRYVALVPDAVGSLVRPTTTPAASVLFVCSRSAARSQLAAALWRRLTDRPAWSAGRTPADRVDPLAVEVAGGAGLDVAGATPASYEQVPVRPDLVVSVCDRANEGVVPFDAPRLHWSLPDPSGGDQEDYAAVLAALRPRVALLEAATRPVAA